MSKYSELAGLLEGCLSFAHPNLSESRQDALTREAAAALRELEAENQRWANTRLPGKSVLPYIQRIKELEAERDRLREALQEIAAVTYGTEMSDTDEELYVYWSSMAERYRRIARVALEQSNG